MGDRKIKLSNGLNRLLKSRQEPHFRRTNDVFLEDPSIRSSYFDLFNHAQVAEIANALAKH